MKRFRIFKINDDTWVEHNKVGIAAINDPHSTPTIQSLAQRQSALAEISGIKPGDILFFNLMASEKHPPQILGIFETVSKPYFDPTPLFQGAKYIDNTFPFRIDFKCLHNLPNPVDFAEIWTLRGKGKVWTLQQSRGDAVGRHACVGITKIEAKLIERLLRMNNILEGAKITYERPQKTKKALPFDFRTDKEEQLHYEAVLQGLLLEDLANGKHKEIFGDYDDFIPNALTGAGKELDILILKYNGDDILWHQILELKQGNFTMEELQKLIIYEKEIIRNQAENPLQVYPVAIASEFSEDVIKFVKGREDYKERAIRLVRYRFDEEEKKIKLGELK